MEAIMENIRDGSVTVYILKRDVKRNMDILRKQRYMTSNSTREYMSRVERQLSDATKFLEMLNEYPYLNCKNVDELKRRISIRRNKLKRKLIEMDINQDGHQISIYDDVSLISKEELNTREVNINNLKEEIHWLHKCLGICQNLDYFK